MRYRIVLTAVVLISLLTSLALANTPASLDSDQDGYPDAVELTSTAERTAFMEWFAAIAEAQYTAPSPAWEYRDCSGLLRFAFTKALEGKDSSFFASFPYFKAPKVAPVRSLNFPFPVLSRSAFRIAPGSYQTNDVEEGRIVGLATAEELMRYSSVFLSKDERAAKRGDLLFFVHPLAEGSSYHSMVYLGNGYVVYHTGAAPEEGGEVRLLSLESLRKHPDSSWHPEANNRYFLGFYRWKIVD
jgi:uncharacterized protein